MTKEELRKLYKQRRMALSAKECQVKDGQILQQLMTLDWSTCRYVHIYLPIRKFNEPDTLAFAEWIRSAYPHVKLVLSQSDLSNGTMVNYLWDEHTQTAENQWGIPEPIGGTLVEVKQLDTVLVPLLVMDTEGNRIGYGKGFYDRFLARCRSDVRTVGISYFEPVDRVEDVDPWDIALQYGVCPSGLYAFK